MVQLCDAIIALGYQFILLDCPAGIDVGFINAISPAKEALIVTTPEITSIRWGTCRHACGFSSCRIACGGVVEACCPCPTLLPAHLHVHVGWHCGRGTCLQASTQ